MAKLSEIVRFKMPVDVLHDIGKAMVAALVKEAEAEFSRRGWTTVSRDGRTRLRESFKYRILAQEIELICTWPGIENFATGIAIKKDDEGNIIVKTGPVQLKNVWIAPGAYKNNFLHKGIKKGKEAALEIMKAEVVKQLSKVDLFS